MTLTRSLLRPSVLVLALAGLLAACGSAPPAERTPPVGSLPDPIAILPAEGLAGLFGDAPVSEPSCRYAESNYRCTWADAANAERTLTVTVYADSTRAGRQIERTEARAVTMPSASRAAVLGDDSEITVWAIVGERGLEVAFRPDDGNAAAHEAAAVALATALATAMSAP